MFIQVASDMHYIVCVHVQRCNYVDNNNNFLVLQPASAVLNKIFPINYAQHVYMYS